MFVSHLISPVHKALVGSYGGQTVTHIVATPHLHIAEMQMLLDVVPMLSRDVAEYSYGSLDSSLGSIPKSFLMDGYSCIIALVLIQCFLESLLTVLHNSNIARKILLEMLMLCSTNIPKNEQFTKKFSCRLCILI